MGFLAKYKYRLLTFNKKKVKNQLLNKNFKSRLVSV